MPSSRNGRSPPHGIHFCVGSPLVRFEARIALQSFLTRIPDYELAVPEEELTYLHRGACPLGAAGASER